MTTLATHRHLSYGPMLEGLAGAAALTAVHQAARSLTPRAPRMDILARRAIRKGLKATNLPLPSDRSLFWLSLAGDIVANSLFFSSVGLGKVKHPALRGALLGTAAGVGALVLPQRFGMGSRAQARSPQTMAMTVGWYLIGGLATALSHKLVARIGRRMQ